MPKYQSREEMTGNNGNGEKDGQISLHYPMLSRNNYAAWAIKMRVFMQAQGVWDAVEPRTSNTVVEVKKDKMALAAIYQGIPILLLSGRGHWKIERSRRNNEGVMALVMKEGLLLTHQEWSEEIKKRQGGIQNLSNREGLEAPEDKAEEEVGSNCGTWGTVEEKITLHKDGGRENTKPALLLSALEDKGEVFLNEENVNPRLKTGNGVVDQSKLWYLDTGASNHMTGDKEKFRDLNETVQGKLLIDGSGDPKNRLINRVGGGIVSVLIAKYLIQRGYGTRENQGLEQFMVILCCPICSYPIGNRAGEALHFTILQQQNGEWRGGMEQRVLKAPERFDSIELRDWKEATLDILRVFGSVALHGGIDLIFEETSLGRREKLRRMKAALGLSRIHKAEVLRLIWFPTLAGRLITVAAQEIQEEDRGRITNRKYESKDGFGSSRGHRQKRGMNTTVSLKGSSTSQKALRRNAKTPHSHILKRVHDRRGGLESRASLLTSYRSALRWI
ncbi:eukaryotic translation initiation factor 3 subunit C-like protein [Tanacetum coccineum]